MAEIGLRDAAVICKCSNETLLRAVRAGRINAVTSKGKGGFRYIVDSETILEQYVNQKYPDIFDFHDSARGRKVKLKKCNGRPKSN